MSLAALRLLVIIPFFQLAYFVCNILEATTLTTGLTSPALSTHLNSASENTIISTATTSSTGKLNALSAVFLLILYK